MDIFHKIENFYKGAKTQKCIVGYSLFHRPIYAVKIGNGAPVGIAQYGIHGREYITAYLAMKHYEIGTRQGSCWLLPLVNPDGAMLSQIGLSTAPKNRQRELLTFNGGDENFSLWKANGRGVDLNVNFDARWGQGVKNTRIAGAENYIGKTPFSESETQALKAFTREIAPDYTLSYHTKGEEIYWWFYQENEAEKRDENLAYFLAEQNGYAVKKTMGSVGGYKDWCIQTLHIPSFTIEVGEDTLSHPVLEKDLESIYTKNAYDLYRLSGVIKG